MKGRRAFTLPGIVTAVAMLAILVGGLAPMVSHQISQAKRARALRQIAGLADSVQNFRQDIMAFPDQSCGSSGVTGYLLTAGKAPEGLKAWKGPSGLVAQHLVSNTPPGAEYPTSGIGAWKGPYLPKDMTDPWGNAYVISVAGMRGDPAVRGWILSAGPNGVVETDDGDGSIPTSSDDLGWRLR